MSIEFNCESCGKHYKVPDAMAGKRAKCKACGQVIQVPSHTDDPSIELAAEADVSDPPPVAPPAKVPQPPAATKTPVQPPQAAALCPSCQEPLAPNAVLCIMCGFDLRKGVKIAGVADKADDDAETDPAPESTAGAEQKSKRWKFW